jgi:hypothetical protein
MSDKWDSKLSIEARSLPAVITTARPNQAWKPGTWQDLEWIPLKQKDYTEQTARQHLLLEADEISGLVMDAAVAFQAKYREQWPSEQANKEDAKTAFVPVLEK